MAAVGGAVRNSSGHWRVECRQVEDRMLMINDYNNNVYQLELSYYRLEMVPGYRHQYEDCMVCGYTGTVQYSTVQYSTVQYSTVQYSTVQYLAVVTQGSLHRLLQLLPTGHLAHPCTHLVTSAGSLARALNEGSDEGS